MWAAACAAAETNGAGALIFIGLAPNEAQGAALHTQAEQIRSGLIARGLAPDAVQILPAGQGAALRAEHITAALAAIPAARAETWLVLLGTIAPGRNGDPSFQVSGPRLSAADFAAAVERLPGKKSVLVGATAGGSFLPELLKRPDVDAIAATAPSGEVNEPRFPAYWAEVLAVNPHATFAELGTLAAGRVESFYRQSGIAPSEHAHQLDRPNNRIAAIRPDPETSPAPAPAGPAAANPAVAAGEIVIPKLAKDVEIERQPATDESRALVETARRETITLADAAVTLALHAEFTVSSDHTITEHWTSRTYLRTGEAVDDVATLSLPHAPPLVLARLEAARVIRPDGAQLLINPRPLEALSASNREENTRGRQFTAPTSIELPEVTAGCIVESSWSIERKSAHEIPELYQEWNFAGKFPLRSLQVRLQLPDGEAWRFFSRGFPPDSQPAPAGKMRTVTWNLTNLPAYEPAPGAPPPRESTPWIGVSSLTSWESFATWYRRLSAGSDETGPEINKLVGPILVDQPGRLGRIRAAYEAVAAVRYVAIELGVGAFRPRTPEQVWHQRYGDCKDKANLLAALLGRLGVNAEFALINRFDTTFADFPGWQFNHALVRVPAAPAEGQPTDLWLDATDRLVPFGVIAPGDAGRRALVFPAGTATGPARFIDVGLTQEPPSEWHESWQLASAQPGSTAGGKLTLTATGFAEAMLRRQFADLTPARRAARLHELLGTPTLTISAVSATDAYDLATPFSLQATLGPIAPADLAPRPPWFNEAFANATRTVALRLTEGRPMRYVQEIYQPEIAAAPERIVQSAGFRFRETTRPGFQTREIAVPAGALEPVDYAAVRSAWHRFLKNPPTQP